MGYRPFLVSGVTLLPLLASDSSFNSPLPTPRPSLAPLGERREPHLAACAALACKHDRRLGFPSLKRYALQGLRIFFPALVSPHPSGWAEERSRKWIRTSDCLSRRRVRARPHFRRAPQVARSEAEGPGPSGRLFFGDFLLAKQKKVTCRRATPGQQTSDECTPPEQDPAKKRYKPQPQ
jgi:hypothetical protein